MPGLLAHVPIWLYRLASCMGVGEALTDKKRQMIRAYRWKDSSDNKLKECRETKLKPEPSLHKFVNTHLKELFGLELIKPEFRIMTGSRSPRPDALAFDNERKCFVIVEYKLENHDTLLRQVADYSDVPKPNLINEYSKAKEKYPNRFPTLIRDINDDQYILLVSEYFPTRLKDRLSAMKSEIHMYEIRLFDNIVMLRKIDDGVYWPSIIAHVTPIQDLDYQKIKHAKPTKLHFPDIVLLISIRNLGWAVCRPNPPGRNR